MSTTMGREEGGGSGGFFGFFGPYSESELSNGELYRTRRHWASSLSGT
jgi:hypothetical protein